MAKTFDLKDESVVVVVGSGAGGGTLSNELVQRGINVVCLEAGPRPGLTDIINDHRRPVHPPRWLRKPTRTGELNTPMPLWGLSALGRTAPQSAGAAPSL